MLNDVKKVAVIGMGVAGVSVVREWTREKRKNPGIELTAFGDESTFGTGVPYQEEDEHLIMNQPADLATIIPEKKYDFVEWLENTQNEEDAQFGYYPRKLFGNYLTERMKAWLKESKAAVIKEKVESIRILANKKFRVTSSSYQEDFDVVHLCMGNFPYKDHYHLIDHPNFIINPFPVEKKLSMIPKGARIGVLGTGLTSVDIFRYFYYKRPDIKLSFFSHSGRFKTARAESKAIEYQFFTEENIKKAKEKNNGFIPLKTYLEWFKKEMDYQQVSVEDDWLDAPFGSKEMIKEELAGSNDIGIIQTLLLDMDPFLTEIWMALNETDKQSFFDEYHGKWDKIRSSFPIESGELLVAAWEKNKFSVFDHLMDVVEKEESFELILEGQESQHADYLINAAGTEKDLSFAINRIPLLSQLLNERILQAETFGGVQVTLPDLSALSQKYGVIDRLKVHGPLISGIEFGNNSIDIISWSAQTAVQAIVQQSKE